MTAGGPRTVLITAGDPAGVGPELCLEFLRRAAIGEFADVRPVLFGDAAVFERVAAATGRPLPVVVERDDWVDRATPVLADFASPEAGSVAAGQISPATGAMSFAYVDAAIAECVAGRADAVVTAPIHKQAWQAAGIAFPGHTELLADRTGATRQCMMLTAEEISCSLVTVHVALNEVPLLLETERIFEVIVLTARAMTARGIDRPSVSVLGLNPHAGEGGLFGREEVEIIAPAVERARAAGLDVVGPLPPDTAFTPAWRAKTDAYVCMYHDQGLIPLKALAFDTAVNVTLGLPIVRTSVDHGTALDIAWRGEASAESLCEAVKLAALMAAARRP